MFVKKEKLISALTLCAVGLGTALVIEYRSSPASAEMSEKPQLLKSQVLSWDSPTPRYADWGQMRTYFQGETPGTKDLLVAVAIIEPGKAVHRAHRHCQEEYLTVVSGSGTWSLAGKEFPANRGDILYAEPWVYHGLTNTGDEPLIFVVVRYNPKGVKVPPKPDNRADEL